MKTVKQTVDVTFKYAEMKDVITFVTIDEFIITRMCMSWLFFPILLPIQIYNNPLEHYKKWVFVYEYEPVYSKAFCVLILQNILNVEEDVQKHIKEIEARNGIPNYANILKDLIPDE